MEWPDRKCPRADKLFDFMKIIRTNRTALDNRGPVVVHCSAGVGRTGVYIIVDTLIENLIHNSKCKSVDVFNQVLEIRKHRPSMVQNQFQYRFIYEMLDYYYRNGK